MKHSEMPPGQPPEDEPPEQAEAAEYRQPEQASERERPAETEPGTVDERLAEVRKHIAELSTEPADVTFPYFEQPPTRNRTRPRGALQRLNRQRLDLYTRNARHILGAEATDAQVQALAQKTFSEYMETFKFNLKMAVTPGAREKLRAMTDIHGQENLDKALQKSGRAVVVTSHMTYFPTAMQIIPDLLPPNTRGSTLVEKNPFWPIVNAYQKTKRWLQKADDPARRHEMLVKESQNPRTGLTLIRRLKKGDPNGERQLMFMAADRGDLSPDRRRTPVQFFDSEVNFPTGPATFSHHAEAPIVPTYIVREGDRFKLVIGEPIEPPAGATEEELDERMHEAMQSVASFFEQGIKEHPEQWPVYRNDYWPEQAGFVPTAKHELK